MPAGSRLSDVVLELPDHSTRRAQRRLVVAPGRGVALHTHLICILPTGELVTWLAGKGYRLPDGKVGTAVGQSPGLQRLYSRSRDAKAASIGRLNDVGADGGGRAAAPEHPALVPIFPYAAGATAQTRLPSVHIPTR